MTLARQFSKIWKNNAPHLLESLTSLFKQLKINHIVNVSSETINYANISSLIPTSQKESALFSSKKAPSPTGHTPAFSTLQTQMWINISSSHPISRSWISEWFDISNSIINPYEVISNCTTRTDSHCLYPFSNCSSVLSQGHSQHRPRSSMLGRQPSHDIRSWRWTQWPYYAILPGWRNMQLDHFGKNPRELLQTVKRTVRIFDFVAYLFASRNNWGISILESHLKRLCELDKILHPILWRFSTSRIHQRSNQIQRRSALFQRRCHHSLPHQVDRQQIQPEISREGLLDWDVCRRNCC